MDFQYASTPDYLDIQPGSCLLLALPGNRSCAHVFEAEMISAVNTALAAGRPLLIRGEPGTGKTQFARASAAALGRAFVSHVLDVHTEPRDLFWWVDAVERLADAQLMAAGGARPKDEKENKAGAPKAEKENKAGAPKTAREQLALERYLQPGPLWWAFNWGNAKRQAGLARCHEPPSRLDGGDPKKGCVLLLDEIDKADTSVPNGLLDALGHGSFSTPLGRVELQDRPPLVIITTNEERELPDAFLRRCLVLHLELAPNSADLIDWLVERGHHHFGENARDVGNKPRARKISGTVLRSAAEALVEERFSLLARHLSAPGQAEYLDILRALDEIGNRRKIAERDLETFQLGLLEEVKGFALKKHPPEQKR